MGKFAPAAFTTLPLAMLACMANPALADPITLSSAACATTGNATGTCAATATNSAGGNTLGATVTSPLVSGVFSGLSQIGFGATASASGQLQFAQSLTLVFDFTVDRTSLLGHSLNYTISFNVVDSSCNGKGATCSFSASGIIPTGTGAYQVTGSQAFTLPAGTLTSESMYLGVADYGSGATSFRITSANLSGTSAPIPAAVVTPEPASLLLAGTGMALAALKRRRNKTA